ncbi:MAG: hypothetical protein Q4P72_06905 [Eubacteriales bacterium]|nr:hypothetical protein [Eubacteriales bacterium]
MDYKYQPNSGYSGMQGGDRAPVLMSTSRGLLRFSAIWATLVCSILGLSAFLVLIFSRLIMDSVWVYLGFSARRHPSLFSLLQMMGGVAAGIVAFVLIGLLIYWVFICIGFYRSLRDARYRLWLLILTAINFAFSAMAFLSSDEVHGFEGLAMIANALMLAACIFHRRDYFAYMRRMTTGPNVHDFTSASATDANSATGNSGSAESSAGQSNSAPTAQS